MTCAAGLRRDPSKHRRNGAAHLDTSAPDLAANLEIRGPNPVTRRYTNRPDDLRGQVVGYSPDHRNVEALVPRTCCLPNERQIE